MTSDAQPQPADKPEAKPRPKRRWYQFSLRAMFVWVAVVAVLLTAGLRIAPAQRQRAAVKMVERLGGGVTYANAPKDEPWFVRQLREWLPREYFDEIIHVDMSYYAMYFGMSGSVSPEDDDVADLLVLTQIKGLELSGAHVTDLGLVHCAGLTQLEYLRLNYTQITDAGLVHLEGLTQLKSLDLAYTRVTDARVAELQKALPNCHIEH